MSRTIMKTMKARNGVKFFLLFVCLNIFVGGFFYSVGYYAREIRRWERLTAEGKLVDARITKLSDNKGGTVDFDYEVDGKRYSGTTSSYAASLLVGRSQVGDTVQIYIVPDQPEIGEYQDPLSKLEKERIHVCAFVGMTVFLFVWIPFIVGIIVSKTRLT